MFDRTPKGLVPRKRTPKQVMTEIKDKDVKFVDLQFMDVPGRTQHVSITSTMLEEDIFEEGVAKLDGSSIKGFAEIYESDMLLMPDPSTYALIPWGDERYPTGRLICDIQWGFGKGRFSRDPRYIAQKAEERMKAAGFTDSYWGPEIEFFVFDSVTWDVNNPFSTASRSPRSRARSSRGAPTSPSGGRRATTRSRRRTPFRITGARSPTSSSRTSGWSTTRTTTRSPPQGSARSTCIGTRSSRWQTAASATGS